MGFTTLRERLGGTRTFFRTLQISVSQTLLLAFIPLLLGRCPIHVNRHASPLSLIYIYKDNMLMDRWNLFKLVKAPA